MTKKEIDAVLSLGSSHTIPGYLTGPTKFHLFWALRPFLKGKLYWYALLDVHSHTDNRFSFRAEIKEAFKANQPDRNTLMSKEEQRFLEALPDKITIYRGMTKKELREGDFGISWTLSKEIAEWFANTYGRNYDTNHLKKVVHKLVINKRDVVAFLNGRKEQEIIYLHKPTKPKKRLVR